MTVGSSEQRPAAPALSPEQLAARKAQDRQLKIIIGSVAIGVVVILLAVVWFILVLLSPTTPAAEVGRIRDVFVIVVGLETLVIGVALVILLVQLASLINLMQNEIRPILQATTDTVNSLRGTAEFLGESVVQPVIKLNGYLASIQRVLELLGINRK